MTDTSIGTPTPTVPLFRPNVAGFRNFVRDWSRWRTRKQIAMGLGGLGGALTLFSVVTLNPTPILVGMFVTGISGVNAWGARRQQRRYEKALEDELAGTTKDFVVDPKIAKPVRSWSENQVKQALLHIKTTNRALRFSSRVSGYALGLCREETEEVIAMVDSISALRSSEPPKPSSPTIPDIVTPRTASPSSLSSAGITQSEETPDIPTTPLPTPRKTRP